ncbi:hypothetical protein Ciccas_013192, partial [Cichlidogyrus casuarinus]
PKTYKTVDAWIDARRKSPGSNIWVNSQGADVTELMNPYWENPDSMKGNGDCARFKKDQKLTVSPCNEKYLIFCETKRFINSLQ